MVATLAMRVLLCATTAPSTRRERETMQTAENEDEELKLLTGARLVLREKVLTLATCSLEPCELGALGTLFEATNGSSAVGLLRCLACRRVLLAAQASAHKSTCSTGRPAPGAQQQQAALSCRPAAAGGLKRAADGMAGHGAPRIATVVGANGGPAQPTHRPTKLSRTSFASHAAGNASASASASATAAAGHGGPPCAPAATAPACKAPVGDAPVRREAWQVVPRRPRSTSARR